MRVRRKRRADRVVLAPAGAYARPRTISKRKGFTVPTAADQNREWLQYSSPRQIELEYNRSGLRTDKVRHSFNIQYPLLTDLERYPAVSIGMRDIFGTGLERQSVYLAIGKTIGLSRKQEKLVRRLSLSVGYGTGYMGGGFIGIQSRFRGGLHLTPKYSKSAERQRGFRSDTKFANQSLQPGRNRSLRPVVHAD